MSDPATTLDTPRPRRREPLAGPFRADTDRLLPHDAAAEQAILGCVLLDNAAMAQCVEAMPSPDAFYDLRHRLIFEHMLALYDQRRPIDLISLASALKDSGKRDEVGGIIYLSTLPDEVPSAIMVDYYLVIVAEKYRLRQMISFCTDAVGRAYESGNASEVLETVEADFRKLSDGATRSHPLLPIRDLVHQAIDKIEHLHQNRGVLDGLSTGLIDLDKLTGGLKEGFYVIAGRPSLGKTSISMNIAEHVAVDLKLPVGVFSLEMSAESLVMRLLCSRARVSSRNITDGFLAERDFPKLTAAAGKIAASPLFIDDTAALPLLQLRSRALRWVQQHGLKLLVVDYLQLLKGSARRYHSRVEEVTDISQGIKALSKELHLPIVVNAQLNRELEKTGRKPKISDLREAGQIEQDADLIGLLYRPERGDDDKEDASAIPVNLDIGKHRDGPTGEINLTFLKSFTRFETAARISAEDVPEQRSFYPDP